MRYRVPLADHPGKQPTGRQLKIPLILHNADASALVNKLRAGIARHPDNAPAIGKMIDAIACLYGIDPGDQGSREISGGKGISDFTFHISHFRH